MASAASAKSCDTGGSLDSREKRPVGGRLSVRGRPSARGWRGGLFNPFDAAGDSGYPGAVAEGGGKVGVVFTKAGCCCLALADGCLYVGGDEVAVGSGGGFV